MGRKLLLCTLMLLPALAAAKEIQPAANRIDSVTVFLDRAEVTRRVELTLPPGAHTVLVPGLPAQLLETSLRAGGEGPEGLSIATVETRRQFSAQVSSDAERKLREQLQSLRDEKAQLDGRKQALDTRARFIERLAAMPGEQDESDNRPFTPEKWATAWEAIGKGMEETNRARVALQQQQRELDEKIKKVEQELQQIQTGRRDSITAAIRVESDKGGKAVFHLSYQLGGASWSPVYDAALDTEKGELALTQAAYIRQGSGEAWDDARITVSTARPSAGASMPELQPWWIDFRHEGKLMRESRMQADTFASGSVASAPVMKSSMQQAETVANDFSVRYVIPGRVTVPADNSKHRFVLTEQTFAATLAARTAPRRDRRAFLYAELDYQGDAPLLPGPWQLQRDGTFVGRVHNEALRPGENIALAFGTDDAIEVEYKLLKDERAEQGLISREEKVQRRYRISITNHHSRKIPLSVFDQLPVPRDSSIQVTMSEESTKPNSRDVDDKAGVLEWKRTLDAGEKWLIHFGYDVSYPQDQKVPGF